MKKITLLLLLFAGLTARGQEYLPLIEEGRIWNVMSVWYGTYPDSTYHTLRYKIEGTHSISDTLYYTVYEEDDAAPGIWENAGLIREDSAGKVWHRSNGNYEETLLYNFDLQPSDTFVRYDTLTVDSVNYMQIAGEQRKLIYLGFDWPNYFELWIEGIGSSRGILSSGTLGSVGGNSHLLCLYNQDDLIWQNPNFEACVYNSTGLQDMNTPDVFQVKYHADFIEIINTSDTFKDAEIKIHDIFGRLIFSDIITANPVKIHKTDLQSKGVYIYRISSKTQTITKGKLINF